MAVKGKPPGGWQTAGTDSATQGDTERLEAASSGTLRTGDADDPPFDIDRTAILPAVRSMRTRSPFRRNGHDGPGRSATAFSAKFTATDPRRQGRASAVRHRGERQCVPRH